MIDLRQNSAKPMKHRRHEGCQRNIVFYDGLSHPLLVELLKQCQWDAVNQAAKNNGKSTNVEEWQRAKPVVTRLEPEHHRRRKRATSHVLPTKLHRLRKPRGPRCVHDERRLARPEIRRFNV